MRKVIIIIALLAILYLLYGGSSKLNFNNFLPRNTTSIENQKGSVKVVDEESVVTSVVEKVAPSVVTVGVEQRLVQYDPFDPFGFFQQPQPRNGQGGSTQEHDIGSGFIVGSDGLIVTNKHVVSEQTKYKVITSDGKRYDVIKIYRDPANDIAILQIDAKGLKTVEMGDSSKLKVGQLAIAMGTPLGEFRGTVTKGIVSGLGRGIEAGSPLEGVAEQLDNLIQTDAAINPGNSGGPLLNSVGQVIGVNTAVASGAENIGFAIPINVIKDAIDNFNKTGGFSRPYLGVQYKMVTRQLSIANDIPEGAYVVDVIPGQAGDKAGLRPDDIITKIDGQKITSDNGGLAKAISGKKVGQRITLAVWRDGKSTDITATLSDTPAE